MLSSPSLRFLARTVASRRAAAFLPQAAAPKQLSVLAVRTRAPAAAATPITCGTSSDLALGRRCIQSVAQTDRVCLLFYPLFFLHHLSPLHLIFPKRLSIYLSSFLPSVSHSPTFPLSHLPFLFDSFFFSLSNQLIILRTPSLVFSTPSEQNAKSNATSVSSRPLPTPPNLPNSQ